MKFGIMVNEGPYRIRRRTRRTMFAKAALEKGHKIHRVFFYHDGVNNANKLTEPPQDDRHIVKRWTELAEEHGHRSGGLRCRGIAPRHQGRAAGAPASASRGWVSSSSLAIQADRLVVFGD